MIQILWDENERVDEILKSDFFWFLYSMRRNDKFLIITRIRFFTL